MKDVVRLGRRTPTKDTDVKMLWEESGLEQYEFLLNEGMKPYHKLLDIGCGAMRGGIHFIKYLDTGNYFGFDKEQELVDCAWKEIHRMNLINKHPNIYHITDFDLKPIREKFDYMFAMSVFSHITIDLVHKCFEAIRPKLTDDGRFYFTFHESKTISIGSPHTWRKTGKEYTKIEYPSHVLENVANEANLYFFLTDEIQNKHDPKTYQRVAYVQL